MLYFVWGGWVTLSSHIRNLVLNNYYDCFTSLCKCYIYSQFQNYIAATLFFLYQQTPLHVAAREGHDYTAKCLFKKGADISIKDKDGVSVTILLMVHEYCWFEVEYQVLSILIIPRIDSYITPLPTHYICMNTYSNI